MLVHKKGFLIGLSFALVGLLTVGCGSSGENEASDDVVETSVVVEDDMGLGDMEETIIDMPEEVVGADPSTWAPVVLTSDLAGQAIDMRPGQSGIFVNLPDEDESTNIVIESSEPEIVKPVQAEDQGTYQTQPGVTALKIGSATISVVDGFPADGEATLLYEFTVNVIQE